MPKKKKGDYAPHIPPESAPACDVTGCAEPGAYKAPAGRELLHDYRWYCLDHIREYNQRWDYFSGMSASEIEAFMRDAVTGHRPTWTRESRTALRPETLQDALYEFMNLNPRKKTKAAPPALPAKVRRALTVLELDYPYSLRALKAKYRAMVKQYHPDLNKGDKKREETFKLITGAYRILSEHVNPV